MSDRDGLSDSDYSALADFRYALRQFLAFSERSAGSHGLTPQQHQALLAVRGAVGSNVTIGYVADRLTLKPHSATGLINRLVALGLLIRRPSPDDRRQALLELTPKARAVLGKLSKAHGEEIARLKPMLTELLGRID